ncbi:LysR family transcriptional regulator [Mesorhizobium sp. LHD-90]|uniref:LysR family transcriptional regulator n=1 Tax=Mesorhizobium sp. LHD-90 TaxID=3071414 RepID=UPI0027DFD735|nr:LysR family transcriptional regulator [Mesorhizobium sp. LHD-90]MDQ6437359.1 LysR family transcriptional regulator [Mesorhizobium sp. LHD-90]
MKTLKASLPLLNAMVAFEATARHGSLTVAASELAIAQSAVSRHIANLETRLAVQLLARKGNRIALTGEGSTLAEAIRDGLGTIRDAVERLSEPDRDTFVIGSGYDLVQAWLMPRFELVTSLVTNGRVMLLTSSNAEDFSRPDVAISIRFGKPEDWPGFVARKLFDGEWFPVCSPAFLKRYPMLGSEGPSVFAEVPLLHLSAAADAVDNWRSWIGTDRDLPGPTFSSYMPMMHEAIAGRGAALAWAGFSEEQLKLGQLLRLTQTSRQHADAFYLITRKKTNATVQAVAQALLDNAAAR